MKKILVTTIAAAACLSLCAVPVMAEEDVAGTVLSGEAEEVVEEAVEEAAEEAEAVEEAAEETEAVAYVDTIWETSIYGSYQGAAYEGDDDASMIYLDLVICPNGISYLDDIAIPYTIDGDTLTFDYTVVEGYEESGMDITITGTQAPVVLDAETAEDYQDYYMIGADDNALYLTAVVKYTDSSDPLNVKEVTKTGVTTFIKSEAQYDTLETYLCSYEWKTGDNTLVFTDDNKVSLNNGASTGDVFYGWYDDLHAYVEIYWDGGATVEYMVSDINDDGIVLTNTDDETNVLELTKGDAVASEEAAETAPEAEAAEEAPAEEVAEEAPADAAETEAAEN